jgi:aryl-alcohol dehydrogenase-like predicted oxidoreductase
LGVELIDLYYVHRVDGKTPIEKTMRAMLELQQEGKIRYIGLSEVSATTLRRASKIAKVSAVQVEYSPWSLDIESPQIDLLRTCRELGIAVVAYSPTGRGMFTGTIRTRDDLGEGRGRQMAPRFSEENFSKNLVLVDQIVAIAKAKGVSSTQLVLAWLMKQGDDIIPIPGTTNVARLMENMGSLEVVLSEKEEKEIRKVVEGAEVTGARYPAAFMDSCFGNTPEE